jgi:5S rRNA maturation endonuclease (ribonuclease M5)
MKSSQTRPALTFACLAAFLAAIPAAGLSHPHPEGDRKKMERVIILEGKRDGAPDKHVRSFHIQGADMKCEGKATKIDETSDKERTRIFLCHDGKGSSAEQAERLEKALARIRSDEHLSAEHRAKVETAIQDAIGKLRATN